MTFSRKDRSRTYDPKALIYNPFSMTSPSQQDDYYAQVQNASQSGSDDKKPIKLKLKVVVKKSEDK